MIRLIYKDRKAAESYLQKTNIVLESKPYYDQNVVRIFPHEVSRTEEYRIIPWGDEPSEFDDYFVKKVTVPDFEGADEFYSKISKKTSPIKIITDQYSIRRGRELFELISDDELSLRNQMLDYLTENSDDKSILAPQYFSSELPDDRVAQYTLFEMLEKYLLQPASKEFYLNKINKATSDNELLGARSSTVMQEIGVPISEAEFKKYKNIRNAAMHFKVVSYGDVKFMIEAHRRLRHYNFMKPLNDFYANTKRS